MPKVEQNAMDQFLGRKAVIKILNTLMDHPETEYSKTDIVEVTDISRGTLYNVWDILEENNIVEETRKVGNTSLYKLNTDSRIVKALYDIEDEIMREEIPE